MAYDHLSGREIPDDPTGGLTGLIRGYFDAQLRPFIGKTQLSKEDEKEYEEQFRHLSDYLQSGGGWGPNEAHSEASEDTPYSSYGRGKNLSFGQDLLTLAFSARFLYNGVCGQESEVFTKVFAGIAAVKLAGLIGRGLHKLYLSKDKKIHCNGPFI